MKVAEIRISVHAEGTTLVLVLEGDGLDSAHTFYPKRVTLEGAAELLVKLKPSLTVALGRCLRRAFEASRGGPSQAR